LSILPKSEGRRIEAFRVFDVSTDDGWAAGRAQRKKWGRGRSAVVALDTRRVLIILFAAEARKAAA
jgi:hypothetical protein